MTTEQSRCTKLYVQCLGLTQHPKAAAILTLGLSIDGTVAEIQQTIQSVTPQSWTWSDLRQIMRTLPKLYPESFEPNSWQRPIDGSAPIEEAKPPI